MIKITQEDFIEIHKCSLFQESNPILIAQKIKVVINEVYKGAGNVPFPEAIFDN